jgi:hypothetical protein
MRLHLVTLAPAFLLKRAVFCILKKQNRRFKYYSSRLAMPHNLQQWVGTARGLFLPSVDSGQRSVSNIVDDSNSTNPTSQSLY